MRDKIGSFMSREEAERFLNRWITNYVTPDDIGFSGDQSATPPAGGAYRGHRSCRKAWSLSGSCVPCVRTSNWTSLRFLCGLVAELPGPAK